MLFPMATNQLLKVVKCCYHLKNLGHQLCRELYEIRIANTNKPRAPFEPHIQYRCYQRRRRGQM